MLGLAAVEGVGQPALGALGTDTGRHGEWLPWLAANTTVSARQSQKYMWLAKGCAEIEVKCDPSSHLTLTSAVTLLAEPKTGFGHGHPQRQEPAGEADEPSNSMKKGVGQATLGTGGADAGRYYRLKSAISGSNICLDVEGNSMANGARVLQRTCNGTGENQRWYARQISSTPEYQLSAKHSAKCLRADGGSSAIGARAEQDACGHVTSQTRLVLTRQGTATPARYQIKVMPADKCFRSLGTSPGQEVTLQNCLTGTNFQWIFEEQGFVAENTGSGTWTAPATVPLIPAAGALLPNRKVLVWSSWKPYRFAGSFSEVRAAAEALGFPCIIKPVMSSSGKGQSRVDTGAELPAAWDVANAAGRVALGRVIVEGFIDFDYEITLLTVRARGADGRIVTSFCEPIGHRAPALPPLQMG